MPSETSSLEPIAACDGVATLTVPRSETQRECELASPNAHEQDGAGIDWPVVAWIGLAHVGMLAAPWFFTWKALALFAILAWVTGSLGVCMGYHRYLTHGSFCTFRPIRWLLAFLGQLSGEGSALVWVANHRKHHQFSDKEGDPHSPRDGVWWSHMLWFMPAVPRETLQAHLQRYAPDLYKDPVMRMLHTLFLPTHIVLGVLLLSVGWLVWDWHTGMSFLVWGLFVRLVYVFHITWLVNSATHIWGYRNYETSDNSRNLWWVGLLAFGEGWHNNHHAFQRMANQGHKWWELDATYWFILAMEKLGLAWNVIKHPPRHMQPD
ncbi:MAG: fatty acid desaturase [Pirellulaceae bacterium]|nr:fatty acid desaturase [Pirellulaceae bacterium]